jgi:hypothetical protein
MAEIFQGGEIVVLIDTGFPRAEIGLESHLFLTYRRISAVVSDWICDEEYGSCRNLSDYQLLCDIDSLWRLM